MGCEDQTDSVPSLRLLGHEDEVHCVKFLPHFDRVVSGGADATVRLWSLESGDCLRFKR